MAKKIIPLKVKSTYTYKGKQVPYKDGKIHFHSGKKNATEAEIKKFISFENNYKIIPKEKLNPELANYLNKVKGGKIRAEGQKNEAKFLTKEQERIAKSKIDLAQIAKEKGLSSEGEIFENKELQTAYEKIMNYTGQHVFYNSHQMQGRMKSFTGSKIIINGKEVTKANGLRRLRSYLSKTQRAYGAVDGSVKFTYKGTDTLELTLPTDSQINEHESSEEFNEAFEGDCQIYTSDPKKKSKAKKERKPTNKKEKSKPVGESHKITAKQFAINKAEALAKQRKYSSKPKK